MGEGEREFQARLCETLARGGPFGLPAGAVSTIETHVAIVFLAGDFAYKMKKAVSFGYLDFTGLDKRRAVLVKEFDLNRATAPTLYRRVLPVTEEADGSLALDGDGPAVEWLLEMRRFAQEDLLSRRVETGTVPATLAAPLGETVAAMHRRAPRCRDRGWDESVDRVLTEMTGHLRAGIGTVLEGRAVERYASRALEEARTLQAVFEMRAARGYVRQCHGDLHLRNIVLIEDRPVLFDCIEFNDDIACQDTLYDLAFLLMDLRFRGRMDLASRVFNAYLAALDARDFEPALEGLEAMPFYGALRAVVRSHAALARLLHANGERSAEERAVIGAEARDYLALALMLQEAPGPRLVAVGGLSGAGKSTLARDIAPAFGGLAGAVILRSDEIRKRAFGVAITEPLPDEAYVPVVNGRVYETLEAEAELALAAGMPVILDAVFARPEQRRAVERLAARRGVSFTGFWLTADPAVMADRIRGRRGDASDATVDVLERQLDYDIGPIDWVSIDSGTGRDAVAAAALAALDLVAP